MLARVPLDLVVDRTSEFSRQMLISTLQLAWTMLLFLFFFLKRSLQATTSCSRFVVWVSLSKYSYTHYAFLK